MNDKMNRIIHAEQLEDIRRAVDKTNFFMKELSSRNGSRRIIL